MWYCQHIDADEIIYDHIFPRCSNQMQELAIDCIKCQQDHLSWTYMTSTHRGYYGLVVVTPPPLRPQTLHRSHDNLKNPYYYLWATQGLPNSPKCEFFWALGTIYEEQVIICFPCYKLVCSMMRSYCPEISFTWVQRKGPRTPKIWKKVYLLLNLKNFLSDCFLIWHVHRYGERVAGKQDRPSLSSEHPLRPPK